MTQVFVTLRPRLIEGRNLMPTVLFTRCVSRCLVRNTSHNLIPIGAVAKW